MPDSIAEEVEVINSGGPKVDDLPFRPDVSSDLNIEACLDRASRLMRDVVIRQLQSMVEGEITSETPPDGQILDTIGSVVQSIVSGTSLDAHNETITKLVINQENRANLLNNLILTHDYERLVGYLKARHLLEKHMLACLERNDLTPSEALAFMKIVQTETAEIQGHIASGASSINDIGALLNKVDYATQTGEKELAKKFKNSTPHDREIVRKLIYKLSKVVKKPT